MKTPGFHLKLDSSLLTYITDFHIGSLCLGTVCSFGRCLLLLALGSCRKTAKIVEEKCSRVTSSLHGHCNAFSLLNYVYQKMTLMFENSLQPLGKALFIYNFLRSEGRSNSNTTLILQNLRIKFV